MTGGSRACESTSPTENQNPAPPDWGVVVADVVAGLDCVVAAGLAGDVVAVGALLVGVVLLDPHPAAPKPSTATQAMAAIFGTTFLTAVTLTRFMFLLDRRLLGLQPT
jgi:hypothetical protein